MNNTNSKRGDKGKGLDTIRVFEAFALSRIWKSVIGVKKYRG